MEEAKTEFASSNRGLNQVWLLSHSAEDFGWRIETSDELYDQSVREGRSTLSHLVSLLNITFFFMGAEDISSVPA